MDWLRFERNIYTHKIKEKATPDKKYIRVMPS